MTTTVLLDLELRSDASPEQVASTVRETLAQTRQHHGCESLEVLVDDADPTHLVVLERWTTTADHDAYAAWRGTPEGASPLGQVLAAPGVKRIYSSTIELS
jgi:quinol monooxygenase YgiN